MCVCVDEGGNGVREYEVASMEVPQHHLAVSCHHQELPAFVTGHEGGGGGEEEGGQGAAAFGRVHLKGRVSRGHRPQVAVTRQDVSGSGQTVPPLHHPTP